MSSPPRRYKSRRASAHRSGARRIRRLVHLWTAQCEDHLGHDGDGDLLGTLSADIDADRGMDALDLLVAEAGLLQALRALGVIAPGAQRADIETRRAHGQLQSFIVDV